MNFRNLSNVSASSGHDVTKTHSVEVSPMTTNNNFAVINATNTAAVAGTGVDIDNVEGFENVDAFQKPYEWMTIALSSDPVVKAVCWKDAHDEETGLPIVRWWMFGNVPQRSGVAYKRQSVVPAFLSAMTDVLKFDDVYPYVDESAGLFLKVTPENLGWTTNSIGWVTSDFVGAINGIPVPTPQQGWGELAMEDGKLRVIFTAHPEVCKTLRAGDTRREKAWDAYYKMVGLRTYVKQGYLCLAVLSDGAKKYSAKVLRTWMEKDNDAARVIAGTAKKNSQIAQGIYREGKALEKAISSGVVAAPEQVVIGNTVVQPGIKYAVLRNGNPIGYWTLEANQGQLINLMARCNEARQAGRPNVYALKAMPK